MIKKGKTKEQDKEQILTHKHAFYAIEKFVDKCVPYLLILLAIVIILDNPLWSLVDLHEYETPVLIFDTIVVLFLVADLVFKWYHIRNVKKFFRFYWLELIAVFPFYLVFRIYVFAAEIAKAGEEVNRILHEAILTREANLLREARFVQEAEKTLIESRPFTRMLRSISRFFRLIVLRLQDAYDNFIKSHLRHKKKG
ncbi:MAG: hypothetical protein KJ767_03160 [Nanoarchaeota archaeon]|nr:hypothetical protein [Nanoarchaeota archaeon]